MLEINSEIKFFNRSNIFILGIMWGSYIVLILINYYPVKELINFTNTIDYISLFAALSAITGILYSNYKSDQRSILSINNSNNQLIEQLTREKKEEAIFELLKKILDTLNNDLSKHDIKWVANIDMIVELYEESQEEKEHYYSEFNLFVQNQLYDYFNEIINNPYLFNYLPIEIRIEIKNFTNYYYKMFSDFMKYILIRFEGELDLIGKLCSQEFEFTIIDKNSPIPGDYFKLGNYLVKDMIESYYFDPKYRDEEYVPIDKETVIVKINEEDFNKLEFMLNKITYLTYQESLKYGFSEL